MGKGGASPEDQVGIHWVQVKVRLFADAAGQGSIMTSPLTLGRVKALAKKGTLATLCQWFQKSMEPESVPKADPVRTLIQYIQNRPGQFG